MMNSLSMISRSKSFFLSALFFLTISTLTQLAFSANEIEPTKPAPKPMVYVVTQAEGDKTGTMKTIKPVEPGASYPQGTIFYTVVSSVNPELLAGVAIQSGFSREGILGLPENGTFMIATQDGGLTFSDETLATFEMNYDNEVAANETSNGTSNDTSNETSHGTTNETSNETSNEATTVVEDSQPVVEAIPDPSAYQSDYYAPGQS